MKTPATSIALVGLGNIGSHAVDHLARLAVPSLARVVLVDRDVYEAANLRSQNITHREVAVPKAVAQARRLRRLAPALTVEPVVADIGAVPPGVLQVDLILTALDSLAARLRAGELAWRLGVPLLDAGVAPAEHLVRLTGYRPATDAACVACALDDEDYRQLAVVHACNGAVAPTAPTNSPASLGALAAALLALEAAKMLRGDSAPALFGRQLVYDAAHHRQFVTQLRRHPRCRFDHARWILTSAPRLRARTTFAHLLAAGAREARGNRALVAEIEGHSLATVQHCPRCGHSDGQAHLAGARARACSRCGASALHADGFALVPHVDRHAPPLVLRSTLRNAGVRAGDVVRLTTGRRVRRFVIPAAAL